MRAYFFGNMYLSSIQQGIQSAHVVADMFIKYSDVDGPNYHTVREWATDHKTMILLNAGYSEEIHNLAATFSDKQNPYPWAIMHEEQAALDGAATSIGIILPETIYKVSSAMRVESDTPEQPALITQLLKSGSIVIGTENKIGIELSKQTTFHYNNWEINFMKQLQMYGLAR